MEPYKLIELSFGLFLMIVSIYTLWNNELKKARSNYLLEYAKLYGAEPTDF